MDPTPRRRSWRLLPWIIAGLVVVSTGVWYQVTTPDDTEAATPLDGALSLQELAEAAPDTPAANEPAPDFSVRLFGGGAFSLVDHLAADGRPVIVNLWASWCGPCRAEMPILDDFAAAHPEVVVVGVAVMDDIGLAEAFADEIGVSYPLGYDDREQVTAGYRVTGLPATFWIDPDGRIAKRLFGVVTADSLEADLGLLD